MIFYFSGTGNSEHIAKKLSNCTGERIVYISKNTILKNESYNIDQDEAVGIVFPVYWYTLPTIVEKFLKNLILSNYQKQYIYAVVTYGIAAGNVMRRLSQILNDQKIQLNGIFGVKMVDNYVVGYNIPDKNKQQKILSNSEKELDKIITMIKQKRNTKYIQKGVLAFISPLTGFAYRKTNHIKKLNVTNVCNGCGQCQRECPCNVIYMENNKPHWKGDCTFCLKCIHGCKQKAIQYGKFTNKRDRYHYPN